MSENLGALSAIASIVGLIVAFVGIFVSLWIYTKSKQHRGLSCKFGQIDRPIEIKAGHALQGEIQISYRGQAVQNLFVVQVTIENTGNLPIRQADVITPLTFTFGANIEFLRLPHNIKEFPQNLGAKWSVLPTDSGKRPNVAILSFDLLNPGWNMIAEFVCTGNSRLPEISAKIEGISEISSFDFAETAMVRMVKGQLLAGIITLIMMGTVTLFYVKSVNEAVWALVILSAGQLFLLGSIYYLLSRYRKQKGKR